MIVVYYCILDLAVWFFKIRKQRVPVARMKAKAKRGERRTPAQSSASTIAQARRSGSPTITVAHNISSNALYMVGGWRL